MCLSKASRLRLMPTGTEPLLDWSELPEAGLAAVLTKLRLQANSLFISPTSFPFLLSFISSRNGLLYHLVSHSSRSLTMRFCRRRCDDALPAAGETPKAGDWLKVRRFYIRCLRCQTRSIILLLALTEALKKGPLELVYAGRQGYPLPGENDYGVS
jgi:hypothetical protein